VLRHCRTSALRRDVELPVDRGAVEQARYVGHRFAPLVELAAFLSQQDQEGAALCWLDAYLAGSQRVRRDHQLLMARNFASRARIAGASCMPDRLAEMAA
jgi:hypothetical protein